jgi:hypothetical protein
MWCLVSGQTLITNDALEWLKTWPSMIGAFHDQGANILYCHCPPEEKMVGTKKVLIFDTELARYDMSAAIFKSITQAAKFMLSNSEYILVGESWLFDAMFNTCYYRLWCNLYSNELNGITLYEADYYEVFKQEVNGITQNEASKKIKAYFS